MKIINLKMAMLPYLDAGTTVYRVKNHPDVVAVRDKHAMNGFTLYHKKSQSINTDIPYSEVN